MPKQQRNNRGVAAEEMGSFRYERSSDSSSKEIRRRTPPVDPVLLKRAYMLQNFQFVIRQDVQEMKSSSALPQSQRRFLEAFFSSDAAAPWDAVTAVVVRLTDAEIQCPICLETPICARITSCGHTFCLPCILQHLSVRRAEKQQRTCPVCQSFVAEGMLRPCVLQAVTAPRVGCRARFTLLHRAVGSCALLRPDDPPPAAHELPLPRYGAPSAAFSRYVIATAAFDAARRERDEADLSRALDAAERLPRPHTQCEAAAAHFLVAALVAARAEPAGGGGTRAREASAAQTTKCAAAASHCDVYGATDGQSYYVHPVCYKMLRHDAEARGAALPRAVEAPIEAIVTIAQDEASRRHYKAFAHVPLHGTLRLCVVDLSGLVAPATRAAFAGALARMRDARRPSDRAGDAEDTSWRAYVRRYCAGAVAEERPPDFSAAAVPLLEDEPPPAPPAVPVWGGHVFNPHRPPGTSSG